jgi:hypothetical protein
MTALADAVTRALKTTAAQGADWVLVTVAVLNADGTCDVTGADGSTYPHVRRATEYAAPIVGDTAVMHRNQSGDRYLATSLASDPGWQTATLTSNWTPDSVTPNIRFRLIGACVQMQGSVECNQFAANGGTGMTITTLPVGYRPVQTVSLPASNPGTHGSIWEVQVSSAGAVKAFLATAPAQTYVSLDNIIFSTT